MLNTFFLTPCLHIQSESLKVLQANISEIKRDMKSFYFSATVLTALLRKKLTLSHNARFDSKQSQETRISYLNQLQKY